MSCPYCRQVSGHAPNCITRQELGNSANRQHFDTATADVHAQLAAARAELETYKRSFKACTEENDTLAKHAYIDPDGLSEATWKDRAERLEVELAEVKRQRDELGAVLDRPCGCGKPCKMMQAFCDEHSWQPDALSEARAALGECVEALENLACDVDPEDGCGCVTCAAFARARGVLGGKNKE